MNIEEARAVAQELRRGKTLSIDNFESCEHSVFGYHADSLQYYMERVDTLVGSYHKLDFYDGESAFLNLLQDYDKTDLE
jgi:hypothetical protein